MVYVLEEGDIIVFYYRDLVFVIYMGILVYDMFLLVFGKKDDVNFGGK